MQLLKGRTTKPSFSKSIQGNSLAPLIPKVTKNSTSSTEEHGLVELDFGALQGVVPSMKEKRPRMISHSFGYATS